MFDLVLGLPVHALVLHATIVLGPLAGLCGISYALAPRWRRFLRWPLIVGALILLVCGFVTRESGEALAGRIAPLMVDGNIPPGLESVWLHTQIGGVAGLLAMAFGVVGSVVPGFLLKPPRANGAKHWNLTAIILAAVLVSASLAAAGWIIAAGHSGANAVWGSIAGVG